MNPAAQFRAERGNCETAEGTECGKAKAGGRTECEPLAPCQFLLGLSRKAGPVGTLDSAPAPGLKGTSHCMQIMLFLKDHPLLNSSYTAEKHPQRNSRRACH